MDDDEIDGVYATASLKGAITYTEEDKLDPDEVAILFRISHYKFENMSVDEKKIMRKKKVLNLFLATKKRHFNISTFLKEIV